ncbi:MAG: ATP-binding cassette domain-containing protein [Anaerolineaceae bacterium]|nr:ATP-binding cassette domain-containing protein [Anaerolineaceae bacterium]
MNKNKEAAIFMKHVSKKYKDHLAVDDLSFQVQKGEIFGLLGPNGAGKTTSIHLLTGLLQRQQGEIEVLGFDPQKEPRKVRQRIGLVPQTTNIYEDLNAVDNLLHHAALYCQDLKHIRRKIEETLVLMQLWERRKDPVRMFSGGMKRRLALARALLHEPEIIFFDEPTLGVDVQGRHTLWEHIQSQKEKGKTFVVSTNDMNEADRLCERLIILDHGRQIAMDTPQKLKADLGKDIVNIQTFPVIENPDLMFTRFSIENISRPANGMLRFELQDADSQAADLIAVVSKEHQLQSINISRPTLDDVFLYHTGRALRE